MKSPIHSRSIGSFSAKARHPRLIHRNETKDTVVVENKLTFSSKIDLVTPLFALPSHSLHLVCEGPTVHYLGVIRSITSNKRLL
jgi:hypothetical protein